MLKHALKSALERERSPVIRRSTVATIRYRRRSSTYNAYDKVVMRTKRGRLHSMSWPSSVIEPSEVLY